MKKIGIIGGGISGLTLGCVLKGSGKECVIFERSSALSEHGAGISLTPNACKILDEIDILDAVRAESCSPLDIAWRDDQGNVIKKVNINEFGEVITSNRKVLINKLYEKFINLGGEIKFNHELLDIIKEKELVFKNQKNISVDYIAGCDGIKSLIRTNKIKKDKITFSGYTAWRGIGSSDSKRINIYLGKNSHIVCYPVNEKLETSFIAIKKSKIKNNEGWREEGSHEDLLEDFSSYGSFIKSLFQSSKKVYKWGLFDRKSLNSFSNGNITLLGDSAHPMMPFLGQGGAMALEDAFVFGNLVNKSDDFNFIRNNYEKLRVGRTNAIKRSSRYQGYINHLGNPILKSLRNFMLKNTDIAMRRTKNIYNYEPLRIINNL